MTSLARARPTGAAPSRRLVGVARVTLYAPIAQRIEHRGSKPMAAGSSPAGRASFNDPNVKHGTAARAKRASIGTNVRAIGFGVASPIARSNPTSRWGFKRPLRATYFNPARRALGFRPTDAGGSFFAMRELMAGAR